MDSADVRRQRAIEAEVEEFLGLISAYENMHHVNQLYGPNIPPVQAAMGIVRLDGERLNQARQLADQADMICVDAHERGFTNEREQRWEARIMQLRRVSLQQQAPSAANATSSSSSQTRAASRTTRTKTGARTKRAAATDADPAGSEASSGSDSLSTAAKDDSSEGEDTGEDCKGQDRDDDEDQGDDDQGVLQGDPDDLVESSSSSEYVPSEDDSSDA